MEARKSEHSAMARWATVRVETDHGVYVGRLYVADAGKRVSDVLADDRQFLSLADVSVNGAQHLESFMAVNKHFIRTLRIVDEGVAEGPRAGRRGGVVQPWTAASQTSMVP
jgi:hypothetical protein